VKTHIERQLSVYTVTKVVFNKHLRTHSKSEWGFISYQESLGVC